MSGTCRGKGAGGCLWNWSQELSDEIIAVWGMQVPEGWGMGAGQKNQIGVFVPLWSSREPGEEEMMLTEQLNWNPTLLGTDGQSEASLRSVDQSEVSFMGLAIKLKYDDYETKLGSGDDQRLNNRHTRKIVISDVFILTRYSYYFVWTCWFNTYLSHFAFFFSCNISWFNCGVDKPT